MAGDPRFDLLFTPFKIGPVTAPNRFYQVPHCSGMGHERPHILAAMRKTKAEGGWGVVNTEYCTIHPSSDDAPYPIQTLWDDDDIRQHALMTEAVHAHGSLAGVELFLGGQRMANMASRLPPMGLESLPVLTGDPLQTRALDRQDIADIRRWHVEAAKRAVTAGFDIVYVYACHHYLLHSFLNKENRRADEYGGSVLNRVRIVRELLAAVKDAVGHKCATALRWSSNSERAEDQDDWLEMTKSLDGLPDIWDLTVNDYSIEMGPSRFIKEGALEAQVQSIRQLVTGPIVTVGRYTSPESMLRLIKSGTADFIGAARPSIADPFLPNKIRQGRFDDIRECIGCNICYAHNSRGVPIRCTQNPTMGEEWRNNWHPEIVTRDATTERVLIIGAGPAGLEAARLLGARGYDVALAEKSREPGGRVTLESKLPGLAEWARVRDWRLGQIAKMPNVELFLESEMGAADVRAFDAAHIVCATGSAWRKDGIGRSALISMLDPADPAIIAPEDIMRGHVPKGPVAIYDDDGYYLAAGLADRLRASGCEVHFVTSAGVVAPWMSYTGDQAATHAHLLAQGITCHFNKSPTGFAPGRLELGCVYGGSATVIDIANLVPVTSRQPNTALFEALQADGRTMQSIARIGDAEAPGIIAHAVYAGHRFARNLGRDPRAAATLRDRGAGLLLTSVM
ncbi:FAD-dependent oxidoreductase [Dongia sp.]|uniref:oxidoreductase n=1 Tax=Dongia sp. TaxID=1977262 RepID=UPI0035B493F8